MPLPANDNLPQPPVLSGGTALSDGLLKAFKYGPKGFDMLAEVIEQEKLFLVNVLSRLTGLYIPGNWTAHCGPSTPDPGHSFAPWGGPHGWYSLANSFWDAAPHAGSVQFVMSATAGSVNPSAIRAYYMEGSTKPGLTNYGWTINHVGRTGAVGDVPAYKPIYYPFPQPLEIPLLEPAPLPDVEPYPGLRPEPATDPLAEPSTRPMTNPMAPPVVPPYRVRVSPRIRPRLRPLTFDPVSGSEAAQSPEAELPPPVLRPPEKGEKEKKFRAQGLLRVLRAAGGVTEVHDAMNCLWKALPPKKRTKVKGRKIGGATYMPWGDYQGKDGVWHKGTAYTKKLYKDNQRYGKRPNQTFQTMGRDLYNNFDAINWSQFKDCFLENEVMDAVVGITARKSRQVSVNSRSLLPSQLWQ